MPLAYKTARLDNGLRIIAEVDPSAHTAACGFFVRTGSRDECRELMGVSHFLEHMMFKGTDTRSADDVNREFDELGASYNAFTSQELTAFHAHVLPEFLPRALDLLADILRPSLRAEDFVAEKSVILEEIAMYDDMPFWRLHIETLERYYGEHPLGFRILGTKDTVTAMTRDQMAAYFAKRYSPDNMILALAGTLDFDSIVDGAQQACGAWQQTNAKRAHTQPTLEDRRFTVRDQRVNRHYLLAVSPGPAMQDDRRYAANMLAHLLGASEGSLLYWALVDPGIAEEAAAAYDARDGLGEFYVYASCPPERADEVEKIINEQIRKCPTELDDDDLERFRSRIATSVTLAGERPAGRMRRLGQMMNYLDDYLTLEDELARIRSVTLKDIRNIHDEFLSQPRTVGRLLPADNEIDTKSAT